jgi:predicted PurR-regulated permease PerM
VSSFEVFRNTVIVLLTLAVAYLVFVSINIIVVLIIAILIASAVRPIVMRLQRWRLPQSVAILIVYSVMAISIFTILVIVLPPVVNQSAQYLQSEDRLANRIIFAQYVVRQVVNQNLGADIPVASNDVIRETISGMLDQVNTSAPAMLNEIANTASEFILALVMGIYWLTGRDRAVEFFTSLFPLSQRATMHTIIIEIEESLGQYLRGIVTVSVIIGLLNFVILQILGVANALTLGVITGIATAIPIIGGLLGVVVTVFFALLASPVQALIVLLVTIAVQQFENYILTPRIMSDGVGFDTILIFVFVAAGFTLNGAVGALIMVPVAGALYIIIRHLVIEPRRAEVAPDRVQGGMLLSSEKKEVPKDKLITNPSDAN